MFIIISTFTTYLLVSYSVTLISEEYSLSESKKAPEWFSISAYIFIAALVII